MWIYIIAIIVGLSLASVLYLFNSGHYGKSLSAVLFMLRAITVAVVVVLLFNPFFKQKNNIIEPATIVIAQDNSKSLILTKDSLYYKDIYPNKLDSLIKNLEEQHTVDKYLFGNDTREFQNIDYQDYYTDIHDVLDNIRKTYYKKNVGAVVLLSDGINNKSFSPEQNIESYPFPVYTVTLGDTISHPDFYINDVRYNKTTPSNTIFPIRMVANARNCRDKTMEIKVLMDNEVIEEVKVDVNTNNFSTILDFNINSEDEGVKQIDIQIKALDDEQIKQNNDKRFFIEVIDKQYDVLFYAKAPHPDLGSLKNVLGDHFNTEIIFADDDIPDLHEYDMVFLHQVPFLGMSNLSSLKEELEKNPKTPVFHIIGEGTDFEEFNNIQKSISIEKGTVNSVLDIKPHHNQTFGLYSIDNELVKSINDFPPLSLPHISFTTKKNSDVLLMMNIMDVVTQTPMMSFSIDENGRKTAYLLGTGIWRWKLYDYFKNENYDNFENLFTKSIKYLLTERDKELVINYEENYLNTEKIHFTADLRNPSQELVNEADLFIRIVNKNTKDIYEYHFLKNDKSYYLNINSLPEGIYSFTAEADYGGKKYSENGTFSVISVGAEAQELVADAQRMKTIATLTDAESFYVDELSLLEKAIEEDERISSIVREETNYKDLINWKSIFFIILSLITIEWFLRKMFGRY